MKLNFGVNIPFCFDIYKFEKDQIDRKNNNSMQNSFEIYETLVIEQRKSSLNIPKHPILRDPYYLIRDKIHQHDNKDNMKQKRKFARDDNRINIDSRLENSVIKIFLK